MFFDKIKKFKKFNLRQKYGQRFYILENFI